MSYSKSLAGVGWISLVPASGSYPDPVHLAEIESLDLNVNEETADLENSDGDVIDSYTSKRVIEGTVTLKSFSNSLLAAATRGVTVSAGSKVGYSQATTIPTTPFTVTVTNGATFATDLGVINLTTGKAMVCLDTAAAGGYSVNTTTGAYTFHTDDAGDSILINYRATQAATGSTAELAATAISDQAKFGLHCYRTLAGKSWGIYVPAALIPGISTKFSKGGWSETTLKWRATTDSSSKLLYTYGPE